MKRRRFLALAAAWALASRAAPAAERIEIRARKFEFVPAEIRLKKGRAVTLAVTAEDFVHGFNLPDFGVRRDLVPGKVVEVTLAPAAISSRRLGREILANLNDLVVTNEHV